MTANQEALTFALKMYGEAMTKYAGSTPEDRASTYDNMCFWQNQAWMLAQEIAEGRQG